MDLDFSYTSFLIYYFLFPGLTRKSDVMFTVCFVGCSLSVSAMFGCCHGAELQQVVLVSITAVYFIWFICLIAHFTYLFFGAFLVVLFPFFVVYFV